MKSITFNSFKKYSLKQLSFVKGGAVSGEVGPSVSAIHMVCFTEKGDDFCIDLADDTTAHIHGASCIESSVSCIDIAVVTP